MGNYANQQLALWIQRFAEKLKASASGKKDKSKETVRDSRKDEKGKE